MQILANYNNRQRTNQISFTSHFVRSAVLRDTFRTPYDYKDFQTTRQYVNAIEGLLKDGRNDIINLVDRTRYVRLDVNDKEYTRIESISRKSNEMLTRIRKAIIDFAEKERGIEKVYNYENLSKQELEYIKTLDVANRLKKLDPNNNKDAKKIEKIKNEVQKKLKFEIESRLMELGKEINKPQKTQTIGKNLDENLLKKLLG